MPSFQASAPWLEDGCDGEVVVEDPGDVGGHTETRQVLVHCHNGSMRKFSHLLPPSLAIIMKGLVIPLCQLQSLEVAQSSNLSVNFQTCYS